MTRARLWRPALAALPTLATWLALAALTSPAAAELEVPFLSGRVVDGADMLSPEAERNLDQKLTALEEETGSQVAVLTVPSLEDEVLEDFTLRVAETWQLGRGKFDDGALLFIARDERRMRLEVGYGLEPIIPDAIAKRILDAVIQPRFRAGDFDGGVTAAVDTIGGLIRSDGTLPPPELEEAPATARRPGPSNLVGFLIFLSVVGMFSLQALAAKGCAAWGLYLFLMPFWIMFPLTLFGRPGGFIPGVLWIVAFPLLWLLLHRTGAGRAWTDKHGGGGPMIFGGGGGGWSSSGGSFGGGFSGGGGSFGGGGASGSW